MDKHIDARGEACPLPVIRAKKELEANSELKLHVLVDNEIATENLKKLAESINGVYELTEIKPGAEYEVVITKTAGQEGAHAIPAASGATVVFASDKMGEGETELGLALMKSFIYSLTQNAVKPKEMIFYNRGAYLTHESSPSLNDLRTLSESGVLIMTCGACVNFYNLGKPAVGEISNMFVISEKLLSSALVIRP